MNTIVAKVSPCIGTCQIDENSGFCTGCARTRAEIANWRHQDDYYRQKIWNALPTRFQKLGVSCQRLPWDHAMVSTFILKTLREKNGTWALGIIGALAEFVPTTENLIFISRDGNEIEAEMKGARLRFHIDEDIRALVFSAANSLNPDRIIIAHNRKKNGFKSLDTITYLGTDLAAITPDARGMHIFDLGLGSKDARFCVRTDQRKLLDILWNFEGQKILEVYDHLAPQLIPFSPERIVETALGRIEVQTVILNPDGKTASGSHTHFLPEQIIKQRSMPVGMDIPGHYLPGGIFYPHEV